MKIGSKVVVIRMDQDGEWQVPDDAFAGTLIAVEYDGDMDGFPTVKSMTIRWGNGKVETTAPEGEDDKGSWEIADATPQLYANIYLHDREYGGPEEGGWWYDRYSPVTRDSGDWDTEPPTFGWFGSVEEAEKATEALRAWCETENSTRRSPSSVLSEGHYCVRLESWPAEPMPAQRPYYC